MEALAHGVALALAVALVDEPHIFARAGGQVLLDGLDGAVVGVAVDEDELGALAHVGRARDDVVDVAALVLARHDHAARVLALVDRPAAARQPRDEELRQRQVPEPRQLRQVAVGQRREERRVDGGELRGARTDQLEVVDALLSHRMNPPSDEAS